MAVVQHSGTRWSPLLQELSQHSSLTTSSYRSHTTTLCSALQTVHKGLPSMDASLSGSLTALEAHLTRTTQVCMRNRLRQLPKSLTLFSTKKPRIQITDLLSPLGQGTGSLSSFVSSCDLIRWHISRFINMNTQHYAWIVAQVPSYEAVMAKAILFWKTAFLRHILVFSRERLCWLSFKAHWVNLGRTLRVLYCFPDQWTEQRQWPIIYSCCI